MPSPEGLTIALVGPSITCGGAGIGCWAAALGGCAATSASTPMAAAAASGASRPRKSAQSLSAVDLTPVEQMTGTEVAVAALAVRSLAGRFGAA
jgi:hypothetical protein